VTAAIARRLLDGVDPEIITTGASRVIQPRRKRSRNWGSFSHHNPEGCAS
jgi:hypothetical protein